MARLRNNLLWSLAAIMVVGLIRPGFHAFVNRTFGSEVNGRAALLISLFFLAALPASASLPTAVVRQVSRALGAGQTAVARGFVHLGLRVTMLLATAGAAAGAVYSLWFLDRPADPTDMVFIVAGTVAYALWRFLRNVLVALDRIRLSFWSELVSAVAAAVVLGLLVGANRPDLVTGSLVLFYTLYAVLAAAGLKFMAGERTTDPTLRRALFAYGTYWFIGTASSLATRELTLVVLNNRGTAAQVGDLSVALSLLMLLAFAPRIIETPLIHELSSLGGKARRAVQVQITERALHWLTILTTALAGTAVILAGPLLRIVGAVEDPAVVAAFSMVACAFAAEMIITPATNMIAAEAPPAVLATIGIASLVVALGWWSLPPSTSILGVTAGLTLSYGVKAAGLGLYARHAFGVRLVLRPTAKMVSFAAGAASIVAARGGYLPAWLAVGFFWACVGSLFHRELRELVAETLKRS